MEYEINKLIDSEFTILKKLGWLLYNRQNQNGGLNKEEIYELLQVVSEKALRQLSEEAYSEGIDDSYNG